MSLSIAISIFMLLACLLAFVLLHQVVRRLPWTQASPSEKFRWPVWSWYPLLVIIGLALTLSSNVYFVWHAHNPWQHDRAFSTHDRNEDVKPVRGVETPQPSPRF